MTLPIPNLDDRNFDDLVTEARNRIKQHCPEWNDLSASDPGMMLLDVFAYCTDMMLYRLNKVPNMNYVCFLKMIGVMIHPPVAASVKLVFSLSRTKEKALEIKRGTRVTTAHSGAGEPPVFVTAEAATIKPGKKQVEVLAYHCEMVAAELAGIGTGLPGLTISARRPPIVAPGGDSLNLVVAVESDADELKVGAAAIQHDGKSYRIWREVENFSNLGADKYVYVVDRCNGIINFAPALRMQTDDGALASDSEALAAAPKNGAGILLSYYRGGGMEGNVSADSLTVLKDPIPGTEVNNPGPATGGRAEESLDNALIRGPLELHSLRRVVTARDFELVATRSSGAVEQAQAFTKAMLWTHAPPGTVQVLVVPYVPVEMRGEFQQVTIETLEQHQTETTQTQIQRALDERRPLGITTEVSWTRFKQVKVKARVVVHREEDVDAVKQRLLQRLYQTISPLSTPPDTKAWSFGTALVDWHIYKIMSYEPGVITVTQVSLVVGNSPDKEVRALSADSFQADTWYSSKGATVFRSMNNARGWETIAYLKDEEILLIESYPRETRTISKHAGLLAVATRLPGTKGGSRLHFSRDCGETWQPGPQTKFQIEDMAWIERDGVANLFLATELGLFQVEAQVGAVPRQVIVDEKDKGLGFIAVAVSTGAWGGTSVAVSARGERGVFLSSESGNPKTFHHIGLEGQLVPVLAVQRRDLDQYLWAGFGAPGNQPGIGCARWRLTGSAESPDGWRQYNKEWKGGSCRSLAFQGPNIFSATSRMGVLRTDVDAQEPTWQIPDVHCGLPLRKVGQLELIDTVVTDPEGKHVMAACVQGIYRSEDSGVNYKFCSGNEFSDEVTLPKNWLFCSSEHEIEVVSVDEA